MNDASGKLDDDVLAAIAAAVDELVGRRPAPLAEEKQPEPRPARGDDERVRRWNEIYYGAG